MNDYDHETHLIAILCDKYKEQYYEIKDKINHIDGGNIVYFFNIKDIVGPNIIKRIFPWKGNVFNTGMFIPIYDSRQDRIVTLKYWGKFKDFYQQEVSNKVVKYYKSLYCYPSGICEYENKGKVLDDMKNEEERILTEIYGTYWVSSLSLPYNESNIFRGNIYIYVGNEFLSIFKIYHTFVNIHNDEAEYLDANLNFNKIKLYDNIDKDLITYLLIKKITIEKLSNNKCKINYEYFLTEYYNRSGRYYNKMDIKSRFVLMVLRTMYITRFDKDDFLKIGSFQELNNYMKRISELIQKRNNSLIKINFYLADKEDIEDIFSFNHHNIKIFVVDNKDNIVFIGPEITNIAFEDEQLYNLLIDKIFKNDSNRKKFLQILSQFSLHNDKFKLGVEVKNQLTLKIKDQLSKILNYNLGYEEIGKIINKMKNMYKSRLLNMR
ncbi:hypothetical protein [Saccharolobus caldissimus]|uniref:Uncharacterized protein n=1 Tax=Saccharolobus caldissimus TaxID=1702097 RepID=A0AAQ4CUY9_9CREN|nr:hypothetical protein [Saccharolobus caldissimus]BDB99620.1 hypothetical protein SACC_26370 [Saccharolobus caldissimus]